MRKCSLEIKLKKIIRLARSVGMEKALQLVNAGFFSNIKKSDFRKLFMMKSYRNIFKYWTGTVEIPKSWIFKF